MSSLTDWKAENEKTVAENKELKIKLQECAKKNIELLNEKKVMEESLKKLEAYAARIAEKESSKEKSADKIEQAWKQKVLEAERKVKAYEKLLEDKQKVKLNEQSLTLQSYLGSYKEKIARLEKELKEKDNELHKLKGKQL